MRQQQNNKLPVVAVLVVKEVLSGTDSSCACLDICSLKAPARAPFIQDGEVAGGLNYHSCALTKGGNL